MYKESFVGSVVAVSPVGELRGRYRGTTLVAMVSCMGYFM